MSGLIIEMAETVMTRFSRASVEDFAIQCNSYFLSGEMLFVSCLKICITVDISPIF